MDIHLHFTSYPGNDHFKNKEYYDALDQYDQALDDLTHFSVAHDNSEVTLLTTMVRYNRLIIIVRLTCLKRGVLSLAGGESSVFPTAYFPDPVSSSVF